MNGIKNVLNVPLTKKEQREAVCDLVNALENGEVNPIEAVVKMKALHETVDSFLKDKRVRESVIAETEKYGKGETPCYGGAKVNIKEAGVKYDFSSCNDPEWTYLSNELERIKKDLKNREEYLKCIREKKSEIDEETGEVYVIYPVPRESTTTYSITFAKE